MRSCTDSLAPSRCAVLSEPITLVTKLLSIIQTVVMSSLETSAVVSRPEWLESVEKLNAAVQTDTEIL